MSPRKEKKLKYAAVLGAVAGVMVFTIFYSLNNDLIYAVFIPLTMAMGCGYAYVYPDGEDEDDD